MNVPIYLDRHMDSTEQYKQTKIYEIEPSCAAICTDKLVNRENVSACNYKGRSDKPPCLSEETIEKTHWTRTVQTNFSERAENGTNSSPLRRGPVPPLLPLYELPDPGVPGGGVGLVDRVLSAGGLGHADPRLGQDELPCGIIVREIQVRCRQSTTNEFLLFFCKEFDRCATRN